MKSKLFFTLIMAMLFGCEDSALDPEWQNSENTAIDEPLMPAHDKRATFSETAVLKFSDLSEVGTSRLLRNDNALTFSINSSHFEAGTAVTVWMMIFNNPENCTDGECGEDDIFDPEARAAVKTDVVFAGSGRVIQKSGKATFAGHRNDGDNSDSIVPILFDEEAYGLINARKAEIHFVIRSHGPLIPGIIQEQISTFNAGCGGFPPELGTPGPNECEDIQFAVHLPD